MRPTQPGPDGQRMMAKTSYGPDPAPLVPSAISDPSPAKCQAHTRLYRDGSLELEGFPVSQISEHMTDQSVIVWLDLRNPDHDDLTVLSAEFGLHPLAVEDAGYERQRPKLDRYRSHLFLTAYGAWLDPETGELATSELAVFVTWQALITVRKDDGLDIGAVVERWDASPDLAKFGVGYLLHGVLDYVVDGHFTAVQSLDDAVELVEDRLFDDNSRSVEVQGNRMNIITKKVTSWAAIIAVPTFITGFYGMNVPYPGFSEKAGFIASVAIMILIGLGLYVIFKRKDWL
jgi:magnesium transporter